MYEMESNVWLRGNKQESGSLQTKKSVKQNLTSLNSDCLQQILQYLNFEDLTSATEACPDLNDAACSTFKRHYGQKPITLGYCKTQREASNLIVESPLMCFKCLRNFGHTISRLDVNFHDFTPLSNVKLTSYVNEYCHESVEELSFDSCDNLNVVDMRNQFKNLVTLTVVSCTFFDQPAIFTNNLFPNLKSLTLTHNRYHKPLIVHHIPKLTTFSLTLHFDDSGMVQERHIIDLIKLNPQLEVLQLHLLESHGNRIMQNISERLQSLRKLDLTVHDKMELENCPKLLQFDRVEDFRLRICRPATVSRNPFVFRVLEKFVAKNWAFDDKFTMDFFRKNKNLSSVDIDMRCVALESPSVEYCLQNFEHIRLSTVLDVSLENVLNVYKRKSRLEKFCLRGTVKGSFQTVRNVLNVNGFKFTEKRKFSNGLQTINVLTLYALTSPQDSIIPSILEVIGNGPCVSIIWYSLDAKAFMPVMQNILASQRRM